MLGPVGFWSEKCDWGLVGSNFQPLAVCPSLNLKHVFLKIRGENGKVRRRSTSIDVISKGVRKGRLKREVRDKEIVEGRRKNRSLRYAGVDDHGRRLTRLIETGSGPPPKVGGKPPNNVGVCGRSRDLYKK
jgi:hypothetical protein